MNVKTKIWFRCPDPNCPEYVINSSIEVGMPIEDVVAMMRGNGGLLLTDIFVPTHQIMLLEDIKDADSDS